jgi:predicted CoA-binding protein
MQNSKKPQTLVIGASENTARYSNIATRRLTAHGHPVVALGLRKGVIGDTPILTDRSAIENIDTITMYVGPRHQPDYFQFILELHPRRVIFNPGTENPELYSLLNDAGIEVVEACTLVMLSLEDY